MVVRDLHHVAGPVVAQFDPSVRVQDFLLIAPVQDVAAAIKGVTVMGAGICRTKAMQDHIIPGAADAEMPLAESLGHYLLANIKHDDLSPQRKLGLRLLILECPQARLEPHCTDGREVLLPALFHGNDQHGKR